MKTGIDEIIKDMRKYSINATNVDGKIMVKDECSICSSIFNKEAIVSDEGVRIPRYCEECIKEHGIINENYA